MSRKIEYLSLSTLMADPRNPKAHDLDTIDASVGRFGFMEPIVLDGRTGYIISGHGRVATLTAMRNRGETPPEGVKADSDEWLAPVVTGWSSRTDTEASAALVALNRTTELGGWVDESLLELLDTLADVTDGFDGVGYGQDDLDDLRARLSGPPDLDDLAAEWSKDQEGKVVTAMEVISLTDESLITAWLEHRGLYESDNAAVAAILP